MPWPLLFPNVLQAPDLRDSGTLSRLTLNKRDKRGTSLSGEMTGEKCKLKLMLCYISILGVIVQA